MLLIVAFVAAGLIAWHRTRDQFQAEEAPPAEPAEEVAEDLVEVEIIGLE